MLGREYRPGKRPSEIDGHAEVHFDGSAAARSVECQHRPTTSRADVLDERRANERFGGTVIMAAGAVTGALASVLAAAAPSLELLLALQFLAGGAWAAVLMSAMTAAIAIGHVDREGAATGGLFALLAIATFTRMGLVAAQVNKDPAVGALLVWLSGLAWLVAGLLLVWLALRFWAPAAQAPG